MEDESVKINDENRRVSVEGFIPDDFEKAQWHSVGDEDNWIFGVTEDKLINQKFAIVMRLENGTWDWAVASTRFQGNEQSKELAIEQVNNLYYSAMKLRSSLHDAKERSDT